MLTDEKTYCSFIAVMSFRNRPVCLLNIVRRITGFIVVFTFRLQRPVPCQNWTGCGRVVDGGILSSIPPPSAFSSPRRD